MKISNIITDWYKKNRRNLPWRGENDPYRIWLSEVILQQTRVDQGLAYYLRFIEQYPNIFVLAAASEQEVIKLWQGLGYYSRARNLHTAARQVVNEYGGVFPGDRTKLLQLKGVGTYTASAVASIAFNEPVAVVDGNVARVLSRLFAVEVAVNSTSGQKIIQQLADELLDRDRPGEFNQAIMEFGALQCVPVPKRSANASASSTASSGSISFRKYPLTTRSLSNTSIASTPDCPACPLNSHCMAFTRQEVDRYPVKNGKAKVKQRYFTYLVIGHNGNTYIQQRTENDIWKQMFEFPLVEHETPPAAEELTAGVERLTRLSDGALRITGISEPVAHQLTHRTIRAQFVKVQITLNNYVPPQRWKRVPFSEIGEYPLPRLIDRYLENNPLDPAAPGKPFGGGEPQ
jgi:A/G-specific adenine glycosylase